jgi:hypothetical protein
MRWLSIATLPLLIFAAAPAPAAEADMRSAACRDALQALQAREAALAAAASAPAPRPDAKPPVSRDRAWQALRARATRVCLGGQPDTPRPLPQSARPPIAVPPVTLEAPTSRPLPVPPPPPPVELRRATPTVNGCDAGGCWMSDGTRMPQAGKNPIDPRVRCTVQGAFVLCQ